jgi:hypothetical protein
MNDLSRLPLSQTVFVHYVAMIAPCLAHTMDSLNFGHFYMFSVSKSQRF